MKIFFFFFTSLNTWKNNFHLSMLHTWKKENRTEEKVQQKKKNKFSLAPHGFRSPELFF